MSMHSPATTLQPNANAPIGIFDSGIGGLSVALEVLEHLPHEHILYYADTAHVPYGTRSDEDIRKLTAQAIEWLFQQGCKIAIVACNTASAFSLDYLRQYYGEQFPIIGLVPAVKPAVIQSKTKTIGVLATPATFRGKLIQEVIQDFALPAGVDVIPVTCLELVPLVEQGKSLSQECLDLLQQHLQPLHARQADHLVLGCTHYPFLRHAIYQLYGDQLQLVDSGQAVARQCGRILAKNNLVAKHSPNRNQVMCVFSGNNCEQMQDIILKMINSSTNWRFINLLKYDEIMDA